MSNYWYWEDGTNTLSNNILSDAQILEFLLRNPKARSDFQTAFEAIKNDTDKDRIFNLIESNAFIKTSMLADDRDIEDAVQSRHNKAGIFFFKG